MLLCFHFPIGSLIFFLKFPYPLLPSPGDLEIPVDTVNLLVHVEG